MKSKALLLGAFVAALSAGAKAATPDIAPEQKICLSNPDGRFYRSCTAEKFTNDFFYRAQCPNLEDLGAADERFRITGEWRVIFEGEEGCAPVVARASELPYRKSLERSGGADNQPPSPDALAHKVVRVLFGTNREAAYEGERLIFTGDRGAFVLGAAAVSIPKEREIGSVDRPWSLRIPFTSLVFSFSEDPDKHFVMRWIGELSPALFASQLRDAVHNESGALVDQAFVFVHGYNTSFDDAVYRTAQLAHDMKFPGAPMLFSWPSRGEVEDYEYDQQSALGARDALGEFLTIVREQSGAELIHLIAHSMGNDPLMEALRDLGKDADEPLFHHVVLAAPDIDVDRFRQLADRVSDVGESVTLYANQRDRAMQAARTYAGDVRRAGGRPPVVEPGVETIDITDAGSTSIFALNHSTYAESPLVLNDLRRLLLEDATAKARPLLERITGDDGLFWRMRAN